jgi:hypothetical protein
VHCRRGSAYSIHGTTLRFGQPLKKFLTFAAGSAVSRARRDLFTLYKDREPFLRAQFRLLGFGAQPFVCAPVHALGPRREERQHTRVAAEPDADIVCPAQGPVEEGLLAARRKPARSNDGIENDDRRRKVSLRAVRKPGSGNRRASHQTGTVPTRSAPPARRHRPSTGKRSSASDCWTCTWPAHINSSSSPFASFRSAVSKPSVNQP